MATTTCAGAASTPCQQVAFVVGVSCDLGELREREVWRTGARQTGWAEQQSADVNDDLDLLLDVDTTHGTPDEHARSVLVALRRAGGS